MGNFKLFQAAREGSRRSDPSISNLEALGLPADTRGVRILWMYPDVLNLHGNRGDMMALLHYSSIMGLPCEIRRINQLTDEIPFDWADLIYLPSGDISSMADVNRALCAQSDGFRQAADQGKTILAIGSTGSALAVKTTFLDGTVSQGLGLLQMELAQRPTAYGNDLWVNTSDGQELLATQIQMADVTLLEGQEPFAQVVYGRGNDGSGQEGARTGNVIFTHCLGPVFTKHPRFAASILLGCAQAAGIDISGMELTDEQIGLELAATEDVRVFLKKKLSGEIR